MADRILRQLVFVICSTQILYIVCHLQFLLGLPQAGLSVQDSLYFFVVGLSITCFSKNYKEYFYVYALILWPTVQLQYLFIYFFNKPFVLQELIHFPDLIVVSSVYEKILYITSSSFWSFSVIYFTLIFFIRWVRFNWKNRIIGLILVSVSIGIFMIPPSRQSLRWIGDTAREIFFFRGIIAPIHARKMFVQDSVIFSKEQVQEAFTYLRFKEKERNMYPISQSPSLVPETKRPIFFLIFESFYDFKHFLPLFDEDPFPEEYRQWTSEFTYSGPNRTYGSFEARFVSLSGALPLQPMIHKNQSHSIASILSSYGYKTVVLEAMGSTYNLNKLYTQWGFSDVHFNLYGRGDWKGTLQDPDTYEKNFIHHLDSYTENEAIFCFGFTYLGHTGSFAFTKKLPHVSGIENFLGLFHKKDRDLVQSLIKSGIFNAKRLLSIKKAILQKYPNALIIFKADHYAPELQIVLDRGINGLDKVKYNFQHDPFPMPFFVFDGRKGLVDLPFYFSPANIPLMILAESKLPYKDTLASLLFRDSPEDVRFFYDEIYLFDRETDTYKIVQEVKETDLSTYRHALRVVSQDLYQNKDIPHLCSFLPQ